VALIIKILSCNKNLFFHGLRSKLPQLFYFKDLSELFRYLFCFAGSVFLSILCVYYFCTIFDATKKTNSGITLFFLAQRKSRFEFSENFKTPFDYIKCADLDLFKKHFLLQFSRFFLLL
jgi:hypothetical protein